MAETVTSVFGGHMTETVERRRDTRYGTGMVAAQPAREADQYETHCHGASTGRPWPFWNPRIQGMSDREVGSGAQVDRDDCHSGVCGRSLLRRRTDRGRSVKLVWHLLSWPRGFGLVRVETNDGGS